MTDIFYGDDIVSVAVDDQSLPIKDLGHEILLFSEVLKSGKRKMDGSFKSASDDSHLTEMLLCGTKDIFKE